MVHDRDVPNRNTVTQTDPQVGLLSDGTTKRRKRMNQFKLALTSSKPAVFGQCAAARAELDGGAVAATANADGFTYTGDDPAVINPGDQVDLSLLVARPASELKGD